MIIEIIWWAAFILGGVSALLGMIYSVLSHLNDE